MKEIKGNLQLDWVSREERVILDKSQTKELNSHGHQFLPVLQNQNKDLITACCCS